MLHKTSKNRLSRWYVQLQETRRLGELPVDMERSSDIDESCNIHQGFTLILSNVCLIHCKYPKKLPNKAGNQIIFRFIFCDLNQIVDFNHPQISTNIPFSTCAILAPCGTSRIWVDEVKLLLEAARSSVPSKFFAIPSRIQDFHPKKSEKKKKNIAPEEPSHNAARFEDHHLFTKPISWATQQMSRRNLLKALLFLPCLSES